MKESGATRPTAGAEFPAGFLDQYQLAVEMADRVSARRGVANSCAGGVRGNKQLKN